MSFTKTTEELDRYYGLGVRKFSGARMLGVMFQADADVTASLLPPPLENSPMPGGLIFIANGPEGFNHLFEVAIDCYAMKIVQVFFEVRPFHRTLI